MSEHVPAPLETPPARDGEILTVVRPDLHELLDRRLNIEGAAAEIQRWSDKARGNPLREWASVPPAGQELYKLIVYRMICQLVESDPWELLEIVDRVLDKVKPPKNREAA